MDKVLIIASHPDDEVLGCGGLISKQKKRGSDVRILFLGEGSSCRFDNIEDKEAIAAIKYRQTCAKKALEFLGIKEYYFNDLPCGRFDTIPIIEINKLIEKKIEEFRPDSVFTHSLNDANSDHRITFQSTLMSTRPGALNSVKSVFSYEVLSSSEWNFSSSFLPNYFLELEEDDLTTKIEAMKFYDTETKPYPFPRSSEGIKTQAMMRGMQGGFKLAEAFQLIRKLKK